MRLKITGFIWNKQIFICVLFLLAVPIASSQCTELFPVALAIETATGQQMTIDLRIPNISSYALAPINHTNPVLQGVSGIFSTSFNSTGVYRFYQMIVDTSGCYDVAPLEIHVLDRPFVISMSPQSGTSIKEGEELFFSVEAVSSASPSKLFYRWTVDGAAAGNDDSFLYQTDFDSMGQRSIAVNITDIARRSTLVVWDIKVLNTNRRPYLAAPIPDLMYLGDIPERFLDLYDFFRDPDDEKLSFEITPSDAAYADEQGELHPLLIMNNTLIQVTAKDATEAKVSAQFTIGFIEETVQQYRSNASACTPNIICGPWSECLPHGEQIQRCFDSNSCRSSGLGNVRLCDYEATCDDNIQNQGEEDIDCGGSCAPCASCDDGLKNGAEQDIDCGGPCQPCPDCEDSIKNQDETDTDCGGSCGPCAAANKCKVHSDCVSFHCDEVCVEATCYDNRKNQGEQMVDCGGPCESCETCTDNIQNQGEKGVDCAGPCQECPSCSDGIRNQGELYPDCFGPCPCSLGAYSWIPLALMVLVIMVYLVFQLQRHSHMAILRLAYILEKLPLRKPGQLDDALRGYEKKLDDLMGMIDNQHEAQELHERFDAINNNFFQAVFDEAQTENLVKKALRRNLGNIFLGSLFFRLYKMGELEYHASLYKIELQHRIFSMKKLIRDIKEVLI